MFDILFFLISARMRRLEFNLFIIVLKTVADCYFLGHDTDSLVTIFRLFAEITTSIFEVVE
jgi:hypothetical protein